MRNQLDRKKQPGHVPNGAEEMLRVANAAVLEALVVVVDENEDTASKRGVHVVGCGSHSGEKPQEVVYEDKEEESSNHREVGGGVVAHHGLGELVEVLRNHVAEIQEAQARVGNEIIRALCQCEAGCHCEDREQDAYENSCCDMVRQRRKTRYVVKPRKMCFVSHQLVNPLRFLLLHPPLGQPLNAPNTINKT